MSASNDTVGCAELMAQAFEHRRGELGETQAALLDLHLATCAPCRLYLGNLDGLLRAAADPQPLPPSAVASLWDRLAAELPAAPVAPSRARVSRWVALGAAAVALAALGWWAAPGNEAVAVEVAGRAVAAWPSSPVSPPDVPAPPSLAVRAPTMELPSPPAPVAALEPDGVVSPRRAPSRSAVPKRPMADPPSAATRLQLADGLQREGRFADAAATLEALVEERAVGPAEVGSVRLDLARLYARRLGQSRRAAHHLRMFLQSNDTDPVAPSVFRELCRLTASVGHVEPLCPTALARIPGEDAESLWP